MTKECENGDEKALSTNIHQFILQSLKTLITEKICMQLLFHVDTKTDHNHQIADLPFQKIFPLPIELYRR